MNAAVPVELPKTADDDPELFIRPSLVLDEAALELLAQPLIMTRLSDSSNAASEPITPTVEAERLTWVEICARHAGDWLLLAEIEDDDSHWSRVRTARVLDHGRSVRALLDRNGIVADSTLIHTSGRPLSVTPAFSSSRGGIRRRDPG